MIHYGNCKQGHGHVVSQLHWQCLPLQSIIAMWVLMELVQWVELLKGHLPLSVKTTTTQYRSFHDLDEHHRPTNEQLHFLDKANEFTFLFSKLIMITISLLSIMRSRLKDLSRGFDVLLSFPSYVLEFKIVTRFLFCLDLQQKALEVAMTNINGFFGKPFVIRLGSAMEVLFFIHL